MRSNTREVTDEPCTKNSTGRDGSPGFGAPSRLRYIHSGTSPFLAQYSPLQISAAFRRLGLCRQRLGKRARHQAEACPLDERAARQVGMGHGFFPFD